MHFGRVVFKMYAITHAAPFYFDHSAYAGKQQQHQQQTAAEVNFRLTSAARYTYQNTEMCRKCILF